MSITYRPRIEARERILTMGVQGTGKSSAALGWVNRVPDMKCFYVDIDYSPSCERLIEEQFPTAADRVVVRPGDPNDWADTMAAIREGVETVGRDDLLVIDSVSHTWTAAQEYASQTLYDGRDLFEQYAAKKAKAGGKGVGVDDRQFWPALNNLYFKLYGLIRQCKGHVYLTAEQTSVGEEDDREVRSRFGPYGVKPVGQKKLGFVPHTVLMLTKSRVGEYAMTTIKDRGRTELEDQSLTDFFQDYVVRVAGWKPQKTSDQ